MQEPAGYLMNFIGGDYFVHADNNRWTDNVADGKDDRLINVLPCDPVAQWVFVQAESLLAKRLQASDPDYSDTCLQAALRCASWLMSSQPNPSAAELGAGISALATLAQASGDVAHLGAAAAFADRLLSMQVTRQVDSRSAVWGFFWERVAPGQNPFDYQPYRDIWRGCWPLQGLCDLLEARPGHPRASAWHEAIQLYIDPYLAALAGRNAFAILPYGLYRTDPGGGRDLGRFFFRYFYEENPGWYVGINSNLAAGGVALLKAARLLSRPDWATLAQRQLDWILGCNPFNASTVIAVGYNNPQHMFGGEFDPATPFLPGAVMNASAVTLTINRSSPPALTRSANIGRRWQRLPCGCCPSCEKNYNPLIHRKAAKGAKVYYKKLLLCFSSRPSRLRGKAVTHSSTAKPRRARRFFYKKLLLCFLCVLRAFAVKL